MKVQFNDYPDVLAYINIREKSNDTKVINLQKCIFSFSLDLDMLFHSLRYGHFDFNCLDFSDSIFQCPVELILYNQEPVYDDKNNLNDFIYRKTKIDFEINFSACQFLDIVKFHGAEFSRDLNFIRTVFEKEVEFSELVFKKYLRLFDAKFLADVHFAHLELNDKSKFFTNFNDITKFEGNIYFSNIVFLEAKFSYFVFTKDVYFQNTVFDCPAFFDNTKFSGKTIFSSFEAIGLSEFKNKVYFDNAEINDLNLKRLVFEKVISFNYAKIKNISIDNVHTCGFPLSLAGTSIGNVKNEDTARFLKSEAMKSNDSFLIAELNAKEMTMHYNTLRWTKDFFDKTIFLLNKISTNFGEKWQRGVLFIFLSWTLSFSLIITLRDGIGKTFIWFDKDYLNEAVGFLWQFGSLSIIGNSYGWGDIIVFIIGKILIAYGVYQTIAAFRKYGRK